MKKNTKNQELVSSAQDGNQDSLLKLVNQGVTVVQYSPAEIGKRQTSTHQPDPQPDSPSLMDLVLLEFTRQATHDIPFAVVEARRTNNTTIITSTPIDIDDLTKLEHQNVQTKTVSSSSPTIK
jgi:hypothetical protein